MTQTFRAIAVLLFTGLMLTIFEGVRSAQAGSELQEHPETNIELILALDGCVQKRFEDVDKNFGFRRIIKVGETPHRFRPENAREFDVVRQLDNAGVKVALYLAGRRVLGDKPAATDWKKNERGLIRGPVFVTESSSEGEALPEAPELWDQAQKAMVSFKASDIYSFTRTGWTFVARPVRASQSCLQCHLG